MRLYNEGFYNFKQTPNFITNMDNSSKELALKASKISNQKITISDVTRDVHGRAFNGSFAIHSEEKDLTKFWNAFDKLVRKQGD